VPVHSCFATCLKTDSKGQLGRPESHGQRRRSLPPVQAQAQRVAALEAELEETSAALARQQAAARVAERRAADLQHELENNSGARPCLLRALSELPSPGWGRLLACDTPGRATYGREVHVHEEHRPLQPVRSRAIA